MRNLMRNQVTFWYSLYLDKVDILKNGFKTGQSEIIYSEPVQAAASISSARGGSEAELFGTSVTYDRVISSVEPLPIDEYSRIWVDTVPNEKADNPDYKVKRVAKGLSQHLWAIEKVVQNGG